MSTSAQYYTRTAQVLHWLMAAIFITAWLIGFYSGNFLRYEVDGGFKGTVITLHKNIATTIIFLVVIRIFWRYTHPAPKLPATMSPMMKGLAHIGHLFVLYLFEIPRLVQDNPDLLAIVKPLHIYLSWFAGLLVAGHILAAIKHHVIDKDNVLLSMLRQPK